MYILFVVFISNDHTSYFPWNISTTEWFALASISIAFFVLCQLIILIWVTVRPYDEVPLDLQLLHNFLPYSQNSLHPSPIPKVAMHDCE